MYNFIDTTEYQSGEILPSEALCLNGEYIEKQIDGYQTLYVSGRESFLKELESFETGIRDGATLKSGKYPARTIIVGYQLLAKSNEAFREAYNMLNNILNVEDAQLIFRDEQDKYFIGTPSYATEVEPGRNCVKGEIEFYCADPFKYSVEEYEVEPTLDDGTAFAIDYKGTYKSFPTLEADFYTEEETSTDGETETPLTGEGDCGYVAFFNEREKIIQLGDPEEESGEEMAESQTLVNQSFLTANSFGTAVKNLWAVNSGYTSSDAVVQVGTMGVKKSYADATANEYYLTPSDYGSGSKYHGPSVTRTIPEDANGETGAKNFTLTYKQKMSIGGGTNDIKQLGAFQMLLMNITETTKKCIGGVSIFKGASGKKATLRVYINGKYYDRDIDLSLNNKYFGNNSASKGITTVKTSTITKTADTLDFNLGGIKMTYRDSAITDLAVTHITFTIAKYGTKTPLSYNGLYSVKFVKHNCETWREILNKFGASDVAVADCKTGEIYLNNANTPGLGALGNDWEEFYLSPGINQIGVAWSDWVPEGYEPTFKMRYREVFL